MNIHRRKIQCTVRSKRYVNWITAALSENSNAEVFYPIAGNLYLDGCYGLLFFFANTSIYSMLIRFRFFFK